MGIMSSTLKAHRVFHLSWFNKDFFLQWGMDGGRPVSIFFNRIIEKNNSIVFIIMLLPMCMVNVTIQ